MAARYSMYAMQSVLNALKLQNVTKICVTKNVQISNVIYDVHC